MQDLRFDEIRVLSQILNTTDPWQVAGKVRIDFPRFVQTLKRLRHKGLIRTADGKVNLTASGRAAARRRGLHSLKQSRTRMDSARRRFAAIARRRPSSISLYDQGYMTVDSVFRRIELMTGLGDSNGKRIAILGDDDLLSIALCLSSWPENVTVFEIDRRITDFILDMAARRSLPITTECIDLRNPLPSRFRGRFHTVVTDPSETDVGLRMFLGRGIYLLSAGEGRAIYFGLTSIEASYEKWSRIQRWLLNSRTLVITHALPENAYYHNWPDLLAQTSCFSVEWLKDGPRANWFNSALVRLETLKRFKPVTLGRVTGQIFCDSESCGRIDK